MSYWILQANPALYRTFDALRDADAICYWTVARDRYDIAPGDEFALWTSGPKSGVYAFGVVIAAAELGPGDPGPYGQSPEGDDGPVRQIRIRIKDILENPIPRSEIAGDPDAIIRLPGGGDSFLLNEIQWKAICATRAERISKPDRPVGRAPGVQSHSEHPKGDSADLRGDTAGNARNSYTSLTEAEIEELTDNLVERREKLDYFYITAFTAILVFTFNNFNSRSGILVKAPVWLVEVGWGALIVAALCPLYVIGVRFKRFAMNLDRKVGKPFDKVLFKRLRRRGERAQYAMTLFFVTGVAALCFSYALGLSKIKR